MHMHSTRSLCVATLALLTAGLGAAQLPATAPTGGPTGGPFPAPLSGMGTGTDRPGTRSHRAQVFCANGQLEVRADNSSLNQILRSIATCTGMRITGGVADQRVFGSYGPAAPATILATLLDGTGSNMLLRETALYQPAELILTPRTGGATPPTPSNSTEDSDDAAPPTAPANVSGPPTQLQNMMLRGNQATPPSPAQRNPMGPVSIPQPGNNVNGSPTNSSPTASTFPTTNSVPLDSLRTPSTTPPTSGIVDAPNPPAAGSDTARMMNGAPGSTPGTDNSNGGATSPSSTPGATNTTLPTQLPSGAPNPQNPASPSGPLTPEQIFQKLQQLQQQQQPQAPPASPPPQGN